MSEKKKTVILAEDDPIIRLGLNQLLGDDYNVLAFAAPEAALEKIKELSALGTPADILLTDYDMKVPMTGVELIAEARKIHPDLPVVLNSATQRRIIEAALETHQVALDSLVIANKGAGDILKDLDDAQAQKSGVKALEKKVAVVVESEMSIARLQELILQKNGYEVEKYSGAAEASLAVLNMEKPPAIIITNYRLQGQDGASTKVINVARQKKIPIIMTTILENRKVAETEMAGKPVHIIDGSDILPEKLPEAIIQAQALLGDTPQAGGAEALIRRSIGGSPQK